MVAVVAPTHGMFTDGLTLQKHANALPGNLLKIVDPVLLCEEAYATDFQRKKWIGIHQQGNVAYDKTYAVMQQAGTNREDVHQGCSSSDMHI